MMQDVDSDSIKKAVVVIEAVRKIARENGLPAPPAHEILDLANRELDASGQQSPEAVAEEVLADWLEAASSKRVVPKTDVQGPSNGIASLFLVVAFKSVIEKFRNEVWGESSMPFQSEDAACVWIELLYRLESKTDNDFDSKNPPNLIKLYESKAGWQSWLVPSGGILEKLYRFCEILAEKSEWWSTDNVLRYMLLGLVPGSVQTRSEGYGNYTKKITITIHGPVPDAEVIRAYKRACKSAHIKPQALSHTHYRLLFLVRYLMPTSSWAQRYKQWLEWCKEDDKLPKYGASFKRDGTVEKIGDYRNLKREYKRAMKRQSWTDEVPRLLRPGAEFERHWKLRIRNFSRKKPPDPIWEEPNFDISGFKLPQADLKRLEVICQESAKINPYVDGMNTFWEYYYPE